MRRKICFISALAVFISIQTIGAQTAEEKKLVPTVTIPAPPGSKGFGMPRPANSDTPAPPRRRWPSPSVTDSREIVTTSLDDMVMSDPFVYPDKKTRTYYLTGSGGCIYKSKDLKMWEGPYGAFDVTGTWMGGLRFVAAAEIHEGKRLLAIHHVEGEGPRKPYFYEIDDSGDKLVLGARYNP